MPQISIIKKSDISEARRFDAEYFKPEYLRIEKILNSLKTKPLNDETVSLVFDGNHLKITDSFSDDKSAIPYYRGQDVNDFFLENATPLKIDVNVYNKGWMKRSHFQQNDILLSIVGTVGNLSMVTDQINKSTGSCKLAILRPQNVNPGYLVSFLLSKYGQTQIERNTRGAVQKGLILQDSKFIKIFLAEDKLQKKTAEIVQKAIQNNRSSKQLYKEAEQLLLEELGLVDYEPKHQLTFETTKKEIENATRYDAEYFQPKYAEIIKRIKSYDGGFDIVGNIIDWKKGIEVGTDAYAETGKEFVRVSDFSVFGVEKTSRKIPKGLFEEIKKEYQPSKGDILFTKDGTIGLTYVLKKDIDGVLSSAFLSLKLKEKYQDFEKECLALILNSIISKMQIEQLSGGAIIAHLKPSDFEKFKIPLIKPQIQKQIADKIKESHKLRKESKELLEKAKRKVEEEIEN